MATYKGIRNADGSVVVTVDGVPLDPRHDLRNLALVFEWGYEGSGPNQLALAILAHHRGDQEALQNYRDFAESVISELRADEWSLSSEAIDQGMESTVAVPMDLKQLLDKVRRG